MKLYAKRLTKDIEERFNGLSQSQVEHLVEYYFEYLGGEDGCEECFDTHSLCFECEQDLVCEARRITKVI